MKKKILFITPTLDRTGSEMVLYYLLINLDRTLFTPYLLCFKRGELFDNLPEDIERVVIYKNSGIWYKKVFRSLLKFFGVEPIAYQLERIQKKFNADLWFVNTLMVPQAYPEAKRLKVRIATYFHELMYAYSFIKFKDFKNIMDSSSVLIGCSDLVCKELKSMGHPNVKLQNSFIDTKAIQTNQTRIEQIRQELSIKANDFVWIISGSVAFMKGVDTVLELAEHFKDRPVIIIWIGQMIDNGLNYYVKRIAENKYAGRLIFTGAMSSDYYNYLSLANGFLVTSKEESFSLVMLEAAYLGIPIVSFNVGMAPTLLKNGTGVVVQNGNTQCLIDEMNYLHENPSRDTSLVKAAAEEFNVESQLPIFQSLLKDL